MFRANVLKTTRLTNQVVSTARNSLNHSIRFNSVAIERAPSNELNNNSNNPTSLSFTKSIKDVADYNKLNSNNSQPHTVKNGADKNNNTQENENTQNSNHSQKLGNQKGGNQRRGNQRYNQRNGNKRRYNNDTLINKSSPWYNQLVAFQDYLSYTIDMNETTNHLFFWESIRKAMDLYRELKGTPDFNQYRVALLVRGLHTSLRAIRAQLTRLAKKPDNDSKSFHIELQSFVDVSLNEIIEDLLKGTVSINENGAMHLLTAMKELGKVPSVIQLWSAAMKDDSLKKVFVQQQVVGVLLPLMVQSGTEFVDIEKLYEESRKQKPYIHPFLLCGMIKSCLAANEYQKSLHYFEVLFSSNPATTASSLSEVHLAFIGDSKNTEIASKFFEKAINGEMPYKLTLQVSCVKRFLENVWLVDRDYNKVFDVWVKTTHFYGRNVHHGISSSLNNTFFDIFFQNFANDKKQGLLKLKEIISTYNGIKPIDEPFFNIIISKCVVWEDKEVIDSIYSAYSLYNLKKSPVSRRIYLKSLGSTDVTDEEIISAWIDLIKHNDSQGYKYIANADWAALRDATVTSTFLNKKFEGSAETSLPKDVLYCQIFDKFHCYCRDANQFHELKRIDQIVPRLSHVLPIESKLDLEMPLFEHLHAQDFESQESGL